MRRSPLPTGVAAQLEEPTLHDLLLATAAANERALASALNALLRESERYAAVLDATTDPISRQDLIRATGIDSTNLSKVTAPLVRAGWLKSLSTGDGNVLRRSRVVDVLLGGKSVQKWKSDVQKRLGVTP